MRQTAKRVSVVCIGVLKMLKPFLTTNPVEASGNPKEPASSSVDLLSSDSNNEKDKRSVTDNSAKEHLQESFDNSVMSAFYTLISSEGHNYTVACKLCEPKIHHLKTSKNSMSNLRKHIDVRTNMVLF